MGVGTQDSPHPGKTPCSVLGPCSQIHMASGGVQSCVHIKSIGLLEVHTELPPFLSLVWMFVGVWDLRGACLCGQPLTARFPPGAPTLPPTPFPGSLPACLLDRWESWAVGPAEPLPTGHGWPARAAPLSCEKVWVPSDKALGPPHITATAGGSAASQPLPALPRGRCAARNEFHHNISLVSL